MEVQAIRDFLNAHPEGVDMYMVDGTVYRIPHRDYISFSPVAGNGVPGQPPKAYTTSMIVYSVDGHFRLVNALLVEHVRPYGARSPRKRPKSD